MPAPSSSIPVVKTAPARLPALGLGTWQHTGAQCAHTVQTAPEMGSRHIDTAQVYRNESAMGDGIATAGVDRTALFLTTKVWRTNQRPNDVHTSV